MRPVLYCFIKSPPVRSVLLTASAIGLELDLKTVDVAARENLTPQYSKINPQHTVPTLDDNGYYLYDSHAINMYLVRKYAKDDSLYPKDLQKKAIVDQRLFFNATIMQPTLGIILLPILRGAVNRITDEDRAMVQRTYHFLNKFLEGHNYIAGNALTIADFCIVSTVSSIEPIFPIFGSEHHLLATWFERMQKLPYYEQTNGIGCEKFVNTIKSKL